MTRETGFLKRVNLKHILVQTNEYRFTFYVPIGTVKKYF